MKRRDFLISTAAASALTMLPLSIFGKDYYEGFETLRRNVGVFTQRGGTIGWLSSPGALVAVDSQYPQSAASFIDGMKERNSRKMDYLINTHHHGDHTAGNSVFKDYTNHIVAHENVPGYQMAAARRRDQETIDSQVTADLTFSDKWSQDLGDEIIHSTYYGRAHTGGDSVTYFEKANIAHMGDLVFNRAYPYIDPGADALISNWVTVLRTVANELPADALYIFGHGDPAFGITGNRDDVVVMSNFLEELLTYTQKGIAEGKSKEEIASASVLPGFEDFETEGWSLSLEFNLNTAFDELSTE